MLIAPYTTNVVFKDREIYNYENSIPHSRPVTIYIHTEPRLEIIAFGSLRKIIHSKNLDRGRSGVRIGHWARKWEYAYTNVTKWRVFEYFNTVNIHACDYYIYFNSSH